tara:strand:+ start:2009 stop:2428 length:420 start_codon:yes stop_codon:yes gene_type:complete
MIDTDKYEGHDTGWRAHFFEDGSIAIGGVCKLLTEETGHKTRKMIEANALLIADAPLLLEEVKRLQALIRSKGLCTNCGQSHEGIEVVMDYSEDEVGHRISKECVDTCHPNLSIHCCDLCLCLNGFTIEHDYWEAKKND